MEEVEEEEEEEEDEEEEEVGKRVVVHRVNDKRPKSAVPAGCSAAFKVGAAMTCRLSGSLLLDPAVWAPDLLSALQAVRKP